MPDKYIPIVHPLETTPFLVTLEGHVFHFSSRLRLTKFCDRLQGFTEDLETRLWKRYAVRVRCELYAALILYNMVETTGFLVENERGEKIECPILKLNGVLKNANR